MSSNTPPPRPLLTAPYGARTTALEVVEGTDLRGRRALVTGGASGIGTETVRALATAGADVTVATRRSALVEPLINELRLVPGAGAVRAADIDLADLSSVASFAQSWRGPLDILVANAGVMALPARVLTQQGWEMQLATNFLGHFALASWLHPAMRNAQGARVVVVSSGAHRSKPFNFDDPHFARRPYDPWVSYGESKTAGVMFAVGASRWAEDGIMVNSMNPGFIMTKLQRHLDDSTMRSLGVMDDQGRIVTPPHFKTPAQGAATSVLLAASPLLNGITGRYFEDNQEARIVQGDEERPGGVAAHALDKRSADRLWKYASEAIVDLDVT
ncbi:SDR family NAD(P)-dependent oxidoreductase [Streptomyces rubiginosohelvolus]|uniref:SDR family NAD(P)-dependent oxidoreductase n=1 Tax=Streptomyces rubiginosohelvolus TaxID=67362 RepID=UPI00372406F3